MLDMQPPRAPGARRARLFTAAAVLALCFVVLRRQSRSSEAGELSSNPDEAEAPSSPWPKRRVISELETLWEVPASPKGVLFVAHGCSHSGSDWWPPSPRCSHCLGLPEEMLVRKAALTMGYAVIAITSFNRDTKCWHNTAASRSDDLQRVPNILRTVIKQEGLGKLPLFTLGGSSGGGFALRTAAAMQEVQGVVCQIAPVNPTVFKLEGQEGRSFPPSIFVHMAERDPSKAETVAEAMKILGKAGVPSAEIRVAPRPVTVQFLQRSPLISASVAQAVVGKLREAKLIDEEGYFKEDPRRTGQQWRELLRPVVGGLSLEADVSQVAELFNVAYARHELVADTTRVSLAWLEAGGKKSVEEVQKEVEGQQRRR